MIIIITSQRDGERESELRYVTGNKYMRESEGKEITGVWSEVENGRLGDCIVVKKATLSYQLIFLILDQQSSITFSFCINRRNSTEI